MGVRSCCSCGGTEAYQRNAIFEGCNPKTQECGTQERPFTYPTMRVPSQYVDTPVAASSFFFFFFKNSEPSTRLPSRVLVLFGDLFYDLHAGAIRYYLCKHKELFERRSDQVAAASASPCDRTCTCFVLTRPLLMQHVCFHNRSTINPTSPTQELYTSVVEPSLLDSNKEVYCENYLDADFNFNMQELVTKNEERSADGHSAFDATMPAGFF